MGNVFSLQGTCPVSTYACNFGTYVNATKFREDQKLAPDPDFDGNKVQISGFQCYALESLTMVQHSNTFVITVMLAIFASFIILVDELCVISLKRKLRRRSDKASV